MPPHDHFFELDVAHRLEVELEALELDDQRGRQLAQADALLRVHLARACIPALLLVQLVLVVPLEPLPLDQRLERVQDGAVPLDLQLNLHEVLLRRASAAGKK